MAQSFAGKAMSVMQLRRLIGVKDKNRRKSLEASIHNSNTGHGRVGESDTSPDSSPKPVLKEDELVTPHELGASGGGVKRSPNRRVSMSGIPAVHSEVGSEGRSELSVSPRPTPGTDSILPRAARRRSVQIVDHPSPSASEALRVPHEHDGSLATPLTDMTDQLDMDLLHALRGSPGARGGSAEGSESAPWESSPLRTRQEQILHEQQEMLRGGRGVYDARGVDDSPDSPDYTTACCVTPPPGHLAPRPGSGSPRRLASLEPRPVSPADRRTSSVVERMRALSTTPPPVERSGSARLAPQSNTDNADSSYEFGNFGNFAPLPGGCTPPGAAGGISPPMNATASRRASRRSIDSLPAILRRSLSRVREFGDEQLRDGAESPTMS